jgi:hypothetical protein
MSPLSFEQAINLADQAIAGQICRCGQALTIYMAVDPPTKLIAGQPCSPMEVGCDQVFRALKERLGTGIFTDWSLSALLSREYFRLVKSHQHTKSKIVAWYYPRPKAARVFRP